MKNAIHDTIYIFLSILFGLFLYIIIFNTPILLSEKIIFYRGIILALIVGVGLSVISLLLSFRWCRWINGSTILAATATSLSCNLCFLVLLPVTIDRSISVYLLAHIEQAGKAGVSVEEARALFINDYVKNMDQIGRRFAEQFHSGNIEWHGDRAVISARGVHFLSFARGLSHLMHTDPRFIGGNGRSEPLAHSRVTVAN